MKHVYFTDKKYKFGAAFLLVIGALVIWASPEYWYYPVAFWALIAFIAWTQRNTK